MKRADVIEQSSHQIDIFFQTIRAVWLGPQINAIVAESASNSVQSPPGIDHIVNAVERADQIVLWLCRNAVGRLTDETYSVGDASLHGIILRVRNRSCVVIDSCEFGIRKCLRHLYQGLPGSASDIGDIDSGIQPVNQTRYGWQSHTDQEINVAWPEKALDAADNVRSHVGILDSAAVLESLHDFWSVVSRRRNHLQSAADEIWAVFINKNFGLLRCQN